MIPRCARDDTQGGSIVQSLAQIAADVQQNALLYASMPFVAAGIGYVTKILAIRMMFEPLDWVGLQARVFGISSARSVVR